MAYTQLGKLLKIHMIMVYIKKEKLNILSSIRDQRTKKQGNKGTTKTELDVY